MSKANGHALTLGACRAKLLQNGYAPCSALAPHGIPYQNRLMRSAIVLELPDYMTSEHPAAVVCRAGNAVGALLLDLRSLGDEELERRVNRVLESYQLLDGPVRCGSDGVQLRVVRCLNGTAFQLSGLDGAIGWRYARDAYVSHVIPLDGSWVGSLLETPYRELPELNDPESLFHELEALPGALREERAAPGLAREALADREAALAGQRAALAAEESQAARMREELESKGWAA